jgi:hypothetical protein
MKTTFICGSAEYRQRPTPALENNYEFFVTVAPLRSLRASFRDFEAQRIEVLTLAALANWERGEREPTGALLERVERFLSAEQTEHPTVRKAG